MFLSRLRRLRSAQGRPRLTRVRSVSPSDIAGSDTTVRVSHDPGFFFGNPVTTTTFFKGTVSFPRLADDRLGGFEFGDKAITLLSVGSGDYGDRVTRFSLFSFSLSAITQQTDLVFK